MLHSCFAQVENRRYGHSKRVVLFFDELLVHLLVRNMKSSVFDKHIKGLELRDNFINNIDIGSFEISAGVCNTRWPALPVWLHSAWSSGRDGRPAG